MSDLSELLSINLLQTLVEKRHILGDLGININVRHSYCLPTIPKKIIKIDSSWRPWTFNHTVISKIMLTLKIKCMEMSYCNQNENRKGWSDFQMEDRNSSFRTDRWKDHINSVLPPLYAWNAFIRGTENPFYKMSEDVSWIIVQASYHATTIMRVLYESKTMQWSNAT